MKAILVALVLIGLAVPALADTKDLTRKAQQGDAKAQTELGLMYGNGQGVLKDFVLAHMWFNIASANGNETAGKVRDELERRMSKAGIERATALAGKCMKSNYKTCR